jgi:hypothetical protein
MKLEVVGGVESDRSDEVTLLSLVAADLRAAVFVLRLRFPLGDNVP